MSTTTSETSSLNIEALFKDLGNGYEKAGEIVYLQSIPLDSLEGCLTVFNKSKKHPQIHARAKARFLELAQTTIESAQDTDTVTIVIRQIPEVEGFSGLITSAFTKHISLCKTFGQAKPIIDTLRSMSMIGYYHPSEINVMLANLATSFDDLTYVYGLYSSSDTRNSNGDIYLTGAPLIVLEKVMHLFHQILADEAVSMKDVFARLTLLPQDLHGWLIKAFLESSRSDEKTLRTILDTKPINHLQKQIIDRLDCIVQDELEKVQTAQELDTFEGRLYDYRSQSEYWKLWRKLVYPSARATAKTFEEIRGLLSRVDGSDEEECVNALLLLATTFEEVYGMLDNVEYGKREKCINALLPLAKTHEHFVALKTLCHDDREKMKVILESWFAFIGTDRAKALEACKALYYEKGYNLFLDQCVELFPTFNLAREAFESLCWQDKGNRAFGHLLRQMTTVEEALDLMKSRAIQDDLTYVTGQYGRFEPGKIYRPMQIVLRALEIIGNDKEGILRFAKALGHPVSDIQAVIVAKLAPFYQKTG